MIKIGVIGVGHVGSHIASALSLNNLADEIYLYDLNKEKALAEAYDLEQGAVLTLKKARFFVASLEDLKKCDILINTASGKIGDGDRIKELNNSLVIVKEIFKNFVGYEGIIINVSNPCDIITYAIKMITGLPTNRVIGTGTLLDSVRLKYVLAKELSLDYNDIDAYVIGEHGDTQVCLFDKTTINGISLVEYLVNHPDLTYDKINGLVIKAGWDIFKIKRTTEFGIGNVTSYLVKQILSDTNIAIPFSHGFIYRDHLIYNSNIAFIGRNGYIDDYNYDLTDNEYKLLEKSNNKMYEIIKKLDL